MWRLWNKLFGWHYVVVRQSGRIQVKRIRRVRTGDYIMLCRYSAYRVLRENILHPVLASSLDKEDRYIPLTFKPEELIK